MGSYQEMDEEVNGDEIKYFSNIVSTLLIISCFIGLIVCTPIFFANGYINYDYLIGNCTIQNVTEYIHKISWNVNITAQINDNLFTSSGIIATRGNDKKINMFKDNFKINQTYICYQDEHSGKLYWADYQINSKTIAWFIIFQLSISLFTLCFILCCSYTIYRQEMILSNHREYIYVRDGESETMVTTHHKL